MAEGHSGCAMLPRGVHATSSDVPTPTVCGQHDARARTRFLRGFLITPRLQTSTWVRLSGIKRRPKERTNAINNKPTRPWSWDARWWWRGREGRRLGLLRAGKACQLSCAAERGHIGGWQGRSHLYHVEWSLWLRVFFFFSSNHLCPFWMALKYPQELLHW